MRMDPNPLPLNANLLHKSKPNSGAGASRAEGQEKMTGRLVKPCAGVANLPLVQGCVAALAEVCFSISFFYPKRACAVKRFASAEHHAHRLPGPSRGFGPLFAEPNSVQTMMN